MDLPPPKLQCRDAVSSPIILPVELITEVLSFLPVKSLMRMKCCCKSWNAFISDPFFVKLHLQRSTRNPHLTLASRRTHPTEHSSVVPISLSRLLESPSKSIALTKDPYYNLKDKDCQSVIGSCNGLICLFGYSYNYYRESWLRIWNPATRTISDKLGHCHNPVLPYRLAFGYDNSMDTYKVVALEPEARVFSFRGNVWKRIQRFPLYHRLNQSVHLSGNVNWLATRRNYYCYDCNIIPVEQYVIISLDLSKETYKELLLPKGFDEVPCFEPSLCVLMDCLCFSHVVKKTQLVIWKMTDYGVEESWTQLFKINLQIMANFRWLPLHLSKDCDALLLANGYENLVIHNLRDDTVERARITNAKSGWSYIKPYVESLVLFH